MSQPKVISAQNMQIQFKSAERKTSHKKPKDMPCSWS